MPFFILTVSEMQIDFASDQLFPFCFGASFILFHQHLRADQWNAFEMSLSGKGDLIKMWSFAKWTVDKPAACLWAGCGGEETRCTANDSPEQWAALCAEPGLLWLLLLLENTTYRMRMYV